MFLVGLGGLEWSKKVDRTHTIHFCVPIPHIDHSRPVSTQFWHFLESPIPAYFCQNPSRGAISHFSKIPFLFYPKLFSSNRDLRLEIWELEAEFRAKPLYESRVMSVSVRKTRNLAKSGGANFFTDPWIFLPNIDFVFSVYIIYNSMV